MFCNDARLTTFFRIFLICYTVLAVLFAFAFIESILAIRGGTDVRSHMEDLISFPLYLLIIWGLKLRRGWVRPLICGVACFSVLQMLLATLSGELLKAAANPIAVVFIYLFNGLFILFYAYQLYFFSRSEIKDFCKKDLTASSR